MARPIKQGLNYFSFDVDFFRNRKITNIRRAHGAIGVLTYINLMCRIYDHGYYYPFDNIEELAMDIAEEIECDQVHETASRVTETIHYLVERGILDEELFEQSIISGVAMQEQYILIVKAAKRKVTMDVHLLVDVELDEPQKPDISEKNGINAEETQIDSANTPQSKIKEKEYITTNNYALSTRACARKSEPPIEPQVASYFEEMCGMDSKTAALAEARLFIAYNAKRKWDCLPEWELAADLWIARKDYGL